MSGQESNKRPLPSGCEPLCPGCAHRHLTYHESLAQKQAWLEKKLAPWAGHIRPIRTAGPEFQWNYRKKVCLSACHAHGKWHFGLIKNDTVIPIHHCPVHSPTIREAVTLFASVLPKPADFPLAYFAQTGCQITLVVKSKKMPDMSWLDDAVIRAMKTIGIQGLWLHLHPCAGKKVFAKNTWHLVYGVPRSIDEDHRVYGPRAFQQLIPSLYETALGEAAMFFAPERKDALVDLYCGTGSGLARWEKTDCRVIGVELDGEAVACARENAPDTEILRGKCRDRIPQLNAWAAATHKPGRRLLYANPPRTGLEPAILEWIIETYHPEQMAYLSCSAGTLQRDLTRLVSCGYGIVGLIPFDFFPRTLHVETLAVVQSV